MGMQCLVPSCAHLYKKQKNKKTKKKFVNSSNDS